MKATTNVEDQEAGSDPAKKVAAQIYGASLLSIDIDTEGEKNHLCQLSEGLGRDPAVVQRLHAMSGAPMV